MKEIRNEILGVLKKNAQYEYMDAVGDVLTNDVLKRIKEGVVEPITIRLGCDKCNKRKGDER